MTTRDLVTQAAARFGVQPGDITEPGACPRLVTRARDWVAYEARQNGRPCQQIGALWGHTRQAIHAAISREAARREGE